MALQYEIYDDNTVRIFDSEQLGSIKQPNWPNGESWANADEAKSWAELFIASVEDENAPYAPNARGESGKVKLSPEKNKAIQDAKLAMFKAKTSEEVEAAQKAFQDLLS